MMRSYAMAVKNRSTSAYLLIIIAGLLSIISEFTEWNAGRSAWDLYKLSDLEYNLGYYLYPLLLGIFTLIVAFIIPIIKKAFLWVLIVLGALLNMYLIILIQIIKTGSDYLWAYPGIYINLFSVFCLLIGLVIMLSVKKK